MYVIVILMLFSYTDCKDKASWCEDDITRHSGWCYDERTAKDTCCDSCKKARLKLNDPSKEFLHFPLQI